MLNKKSCFESKVTFDIELWDLDKALSFCFMKAQTEEERGKLNNYILKFKYNEMQLFKYIYVF